MRAVLNEVAALQRRLAAAADPSTRAWWERYMKDVLPFRGARMADPRRAVHAWHAKDGPASRSAGLRYALEKSDPDVPDRWLARHAVRRDHQRNRP
ncbi:MAG: hypothetical protein MJB57_06690 [Gemmatimonadetes bacterium]|nr:hypothetical protein [Gemmatimonadota bacterium]